MIEIKDIHGRTIFETPVNENSVHHKKLMAEDYISLRFNLDEPVTFERGYYVDMTFGKYEIVDITYPTYNASTGGYEYELRFDAYYWKWKNKILFYDRQGNKEAAWSLTRTPDAHLSIVCSNLKALGYTYNNGVEFDFSIDTSVDMSAKLVQYDGTNIIDALTLIAETWDCEWWVEDHVIHLGRCEYNTALTFELAKNVQSMSRSESNDNFSTRIIAFGSERNLPVNYRDNEGIVVEGVVQKRLMLPVGTPYIDAYEDMYQEQAVEDVVIFDDVYPRRIGTMSDVTTKEYTDTIENEDGSTTKEKWNAYRFKDTGLNFSEKYVLPGNELWIVFTSGALNGMDFAVWFNPDKKDESTPEGQLWEIVRNGNYGRALPDNELKPKDSDKYILYGFDTSFVSDTYLPAAEQELKQRAEEYVEKSKEDPAVYDCQMNMIDMIENDIDLNIGHRVHLINKAYFENGRDSRIYGFEKHLDGSRVTYTIGNTAKYSRLAEMEGQIKEIAYGGNVYSGGGGSNIYVIGRYDSTNPTDRNVLSSTRTLYEIQQRALSRLMDDVAAGHITFDKGFTAHDFATMYKGIVKEYLSSEKFIPGFFGEGFKIYDDSGSWTAEFDNVVVRKAMTIYELIISKIRSVNGGLVISPANGRVKSVAKTTGSPAYYVLGIEGDMEFVVGDLVRCQVFSSNNLKHYWVEVKQVSGDTILCLESDFKGAVPQVGDDIVQMGNTSNVNRQGVLYLTASEDGKPRIQVLGGVNTTNFSGKNKAILGCLDGITDTDFPADLQPSGYGLHTDNFFGKGILLLRSGKTVEQDAQDRVDGVQIGGRNFIRNGNFSKDWNHWFFWGSCNRELIEYDGRKVAHLYTDNTQIYRGISQPIYIFKPNTYYTISFLAKKIEGSGGILIGFHQRGNYSNDPQIWKSIEVSTEYEKYSFAFISANDSLKNEFGFMVGGYNGMPFDLYITDLQFEEGNKATGWTPAPEDTDAAIESVREELTTEITAIPGKIEMAVNSIQVGARNIFLTSGQFGNSISNWKNNGGGLIIDSSLKYNGYNTIRTVVGSGIVGNWYKLQNGEVYTYSAMIYSSGSATGSGSSPLHYWSGKDNVNQGKISVIKCDTNVIAGKWKLCYITFRLTNDADSFRPFIYWGGIQSLTFNIAYLKLEKGNKPTDWSPAPEDTDTAISGLDGRITANKTSITQLSTEISLKASKEELDSLGETVAKNSSEINLMPDKISLAVENIQIGGRNLALNSVRIVTRSVTYPMSKSSFDLRGKTITISFEYEYTNVSTGTIAQQRRFGFEWGVSVPSGALYYGCWVQLPASSIGLSGNGKKITTHILASDITSNLTTAPVHIQVLGGIVKIWNFKLEEGNKPTDWSPAPEDQASVSQLLATGINITNGQIELIANKTFVKDNSGNNIALFITKNGKPLVKAENIDVDNLVAKKIEAVTGTFESISGTWGSDSMLLTPSLLRFLGKYSTLFVGAETAPATMGGMLTLPIRLTVNRTISDAAQGNAGIFLSVQGATAYDDVLTSGNHALFIEKGDICGFRLRTRRVKTSQTLNVMDSIIMCSATTDITLTLPTGSEDGHILFIRKMSSNNITVSGRIAGSSGNIVTSCTIKYGALHIFIYDKRNNVWSGNFADQI